eukprot:359920-Chlamydomonas_euryale.AAC.5
MGEIKVSETLLQWTRDQAFSPTGTLLESRPTDYGLAKKAIVSSGGRATVQKGPGCRPWPWASISGPGSACSLYQWPGVGLQSLSVDRCRSAVSISGLACSLYQWPGLGLQSLSLARYRPAISISGPACSGAIVMGKPGAVLDAVVVTNT